MNRPFEQTHPIQAWRREILAGVCLVAWFLALAFLPDPRPLSAPAPAVKAIKSLSGLSEPFARTIASVSIRAVAFGLLGMLVSFTLGRVSARIAIPLGLILASALAMLGQWINYGYPPVAMQLKVSLPSAVVGALVGIAFRRGRYGLLALVAIVAIVVGLFVWGTSTNVSRDLDDTGRQMVSHILDYAGDIRPGDEGFVDAVRLAFSFAEDNSHGRDAVDANRAAILALGIIFGDDKIARIARSDLDPQWQEGIDRMRQRVTLRGRSDTPRHFWVSAALVVLTDETRATTVGVAKELMDANPGGTGFSFADLAANRAGILFTLAATRDAAAATAMQMSIVNDGLHAADFCPEIEDLPEGLTRDQFQSEFGGLPGRRTRDLQSEIDRRVTALPIHRLGR